MRFESSLLDAGEKTSFEAYVDRAKEEQDTIYYLVGLDREVMENGPYLEAFKQRGIEVALFTDSVDDYVLETLREFKGKKLVCADRAEIELEDSPSDEEGLDEKASEEFRGVG